MVNSIREYWGVYFKRRKYEVWTVGHMRRICVIDGESNKYGNPDKEAEAHANLIAAAPNMLKALEACLNCTDMSLDELDPSTEEAIKLAQEAIAEAKGEN